MDKELKEFFDDEDYQAYLDDKKAEKDKFYTNEVYQESGSQ